MSSIANASDIIIAAQRAFAWRQRPSRLSDEAGEEAAALNTYFSNMDPRSISLDDLLDYPHDLSAITAFFSKYALLYFLPALIRISLVEHDRADVLPLSVLLAFSTHGRASEDLARLDELVSQMTSEEKDAIQAFVAFMQEKHGKDYPHVDFAGIQDALGA